MSASEEIVIAPQPGPQVQFLSSRADIVFYGGAAGGGKTYGLLLEPLRHFNNPNFGCVIFRRNAKQVRNEGGLWHESTKLYTQLGGRPREAFLDWQFPPGMRVKFDHLEYEKDVYNHQGSQINLLGFDEITHFSQAQFFYMLSRNRSTSGVPSYCRATCNPDADSWVRDFIGWWIGDDGYAIPERSGKLRYFIRVDEELVWADTREELVERYGAESMPKSVTFIPSKITDNKILMDADPTYMASLKALSRVDRLRLLGGDWNIRHSSGNIFKREWFPIIDAIPANWTDAVRFWDRAATKPPEDGSSAPLKTGQKKPDWTRGVLMYRYPNGSFVVADMRSMQDTPFKVQDLIESTASHDSHAIRIASQQDPGSAGVFEAEYFKRSLAGYSVSTMLTSKDKLTRAKPVSAQAEIGNIRVLRGPWNKAFFAELEGFPDVDNDDIVDALSGAFNTLCGDGTSMFDVL